MVNSLVCLFVENAAPDIGGKCAKSEPKVSRSVEFYKRSQTS